MGLVVVGNSALCLRAGNTSPYAHNSFSNDYRWMVSLALVRVIRSLYNIHDLGYALLLRCSNNSTGWTLIIIPTLGIIIKLGAKRTVTTSCFLSIKLTVQEYDRHEHYWAEPLFASSFHIRAQILLYSGQTIRWTNAFVAVTRVLAIFS